MTAVLDVHADPDHHRSVLTLGGPLERRGRRPRVVARPWPASISVSTSGPPALGAADVVPFVPLPPGPSADGRPPTTSGPACSGPGTDSPTGPAPSWRCPASSTDRSGRCPTSAATAFRAARAGHRAVGSPTPRRAPPRSAPGPCSSPTTSGSRPGRRGPGRRRGPCAVGGPVAGRRLRGPSVRSPGLPVDGGAQVSCNLIDPGAGRPWRRSSTRWPPAPSRMGCSVLRAELVGLVPAAALDADPPPALARARPGRGPDHRRAACGTGA